MSDETSLVSGRFTKLENGGVRVLVLLLVPGRDSRHRETRTIGSDGISVLSSPIGSRSAVASRLRERGGRRGRRSPRRIEKLVPDNTGQTTRTAHVRPHTVTAYENRIDGHDRIPGAMVDRTTTYANAPPSAATRARVARPVRTSTSRLPCPRRPRLLAF